MKFISFYYDGTETKYYEKCFHRLASQLQELKLPFNFENINFEKSNYQNITLSKPQFILRKLKELNESVIWIDIDCYFITKFDDFSFLNDKITFFIREHDNKTPHSALIYFPHSEESIQFLERWAEKCKSKMNDPTYNCGDHCQLIETYNEFKDKINFQNIFGVCSVMQNTPIRIGISQGGVDVERNKK